MASTFITLALALHFVLFSAGAVQLNLTEIIVRGGQYDKLLLFLSKSPQALVQIQNQLNSTRGITIFAPTNNAFEKVKPAGFFNNLNDQDKASILLYHCLPQFYQLTDFTTVSNPVNTMAYQNYILNIIADSSNPPHVNISTGLVNVQISNVLNVTAPSLALYSIETVLVPSELSGAPSSNSPKPPPPPPKGTPPTTTSPAANETSPAPKAPSPTNDGNSRTNVPWWSALIGVAACVSSTFI